MGNKIFIAKNIYNRVSEFIDQIYDIATEGMSNEEKTAYGLGTLNALNAIDSVVIDEYPVVCLGVEDDEEMTVEEVFEQFDKDSNGEEDYDE
jgi:hypothetical protein